MSTNNGSLCPTFVLTHASLTDLGMRRMNNQDALAVVVTDDPATWASRGHLLMVADGMGAHAAGELASKIAVDNISHTYFKLRDLYPPAALRQAIREANAAIHAKGQSSIGFQGMGTTCSCLVLLPQGALVAHIGDSRVYRLRGQVLEQLTFDHSLVWEMAAAGQMAQEDVPAYIPKNVITRSLGPHATVHVDLEGPYDAAAGDIFLLCSDGLSGPLSDEEIGAILQCLPPHEAVQTLVDLANLRGGPDNISVIIAKIDGETPLVEGGNAQPACLVSSYRPRQTVPLWLASGASLVLLAYCLVNRMWLGAMLSAAALGASLLATVGVRARQTRLPSVKVGTLGGPYGNGPYRKTNCPPDSRMVAVLAEMAAALRALPEKEPDRWTIDWSSFDAERAQAVAAAERADHVEAVRRYCCAIRQAMRQFGEHRPTVESDSNLP